MWSWLKRLFKKREDQKEIIEIPKNPEKPPEKLGTPPVNPSTTEKPDFKQLWNSVVINDGLDRAISVTCAIIKRYQSRYEAVEKETGLSWKIIAALHYRESSLNFNTCLHNGDQLPGPTVNVPKGRGPFSSWEASAIDAINLDGISGPKDIESALKACEAFNGLGYRRKGIYSPYIWAGTNHYEKGKYTYDGVYNPLAVDKQLGVAVILKALEFEP